MDFQEWVGWVFTRRNVQTIDPDQPLPTVAFDLRNIPGLQKDVEFAGKEIVEHLDDDVDGDYAINIRLKVNPSDLKVTATVKVTLPNTIEYSKKTVYAIRENGCLRLPAERQLSLL